MIKAQNLRIKLLLILIISGLIGCSSDANSGTSTDEFLEARWETGDFRSSSDFNSVSASKIESTRFTTLLVQGLDNNGAAVVISISEYNGTGSYDLGFENSNGTSATYATPLVTYSSVAGEGGVGTVVITDDTEGVVAGTFNFTGIELDDIVSPIIIQEGSFLAKLENQE